MDWSLHGFGRIAGKGDLKPGDLFVVMTGMGTQALCFVVEPKGAVLSAIILTDSGSENSEDLPRGILLDYVVQNDVLVRLVEGPFTIEPVDSSWKSRFSDAHETPAPNGVLALYEGGECGIYVRVNGYPAVTWDLKTGGSCPPGRPRHLVHWRLLWGAQNPMVIYQR
jgi:hypothetical protein